MAILVTGGAGFIGTHTCVELLEAGEDIVVFDNLVNSKRSAIDAVKQITGKDFPFYEADMLDEAAMEKIFSAHNITEVIHFAGLKAVGESVEKPLEYYHNNLTGTLILLQVMRRHNVKRIVFSSSATVYGSPKTVPIKEDFPLSTTNPYGATKLIIENMLRDLYHSDNSWSIALLRYFNPIGAHESGLIGEDPNGIPNNIMPRLINVALGKMDSMTVFGDDYPTRDGTGVRDYIHVVDLAKGHVAAIAKVRSQTMCDAYNLGTGKGYSVLEIIHGLEKACGKKLPYHVTPRRAGDIAECYADPTKAAEELHWKATMDLDQMCKDAWHFALMHQKNN
ncbi:MAG: UDP-glucose 4-epimerase GalE [Clostridiales bacterium]|nr:UDP-glucose 4-epimerase GalE [Clostridiales bacterium]